jgi:L-ascorbate 6-phosphate lactonase
MLITGTTHQELVDEIDSTAVSHGECAFWWMGQHGFILKLGEVVLYIDVYLTPSDARNVAPLLRPEEVTDADGILGTHDHGDHIDRPSWPGMAKASPHAVVVVPALVRDDLITDLNLPSDQVVGLDDGLSTTIKGVKITAVPAAHELLHIDPETGFHPFLGYVIEGNGFCVYHAGDTCIYEGIQARLRHWKFDLAFLPINGRCARRFTTGCIGNMTYQEAVDLAGAIKPGVTVPTHFEMFDGNTENPQHFLDYIQAKYPHLPAQAPAHGVRAVVKSGIPIRTP